MRLLLLIACLITTTLLGARLLAAAEKGWFGFTADVQAESVFSFDPTIRAIKIGKVEPDSPAARAGLAAGDEILELENVKVTGNKASQLKPHMQGLPLVRSGSFRGYLLQISRQAKGC